MKLSCCDRSNLVQFVMKTKQDNDMIDNIGLVYIKTKKQIEISFETIPPLFQTDGSVVPTYHHVYIKHNKEPLIPQQEPKWEMTRSNEFP